MVGLIVFNGKAYKTVEEMPPDIRRAYEQVMGIFADNNKDGVPDALEGLASVNVQNSGFRSTTIIFEGKQYQSPDDLPAEARKKYDQSIGRLDADRDGVADILEGMISTSIAGTAAPVASSGTPTQAPPQPAHSTIEPESVGGRWIIAALIAGALLCAAAAAVLLAIRQ